MLESKWLYEIMLVIYSLSLIGYFFDFIKKNWKVNRISFSLLCIVWAMQTALLYNQTFIIKSFRILSLNEGLFLYAWILLTSSLIINLFRSEEHTSERQSRGHLVCSPLLEKSSRSPW